MKIDQLQTEQRNQKTLHLDALSAYEIVQIMNEEDQKVISAVHQATDKIAEAVTIITACLKAGGRLIYIGAGTSGRLGILDAVECVPTFSTDKVIGLIAGGNNAFIKAVEGAEDDEQLGKQDLEELNICENDAVVGIAASGRTPYVIGALKYANRCGAHTISLSCNLQSEIAKYATTTIEVDAGAEVLSGSTRLKAGTAQKMILNMLSTASMVGIGKVYGNLMVDMKATNQKLVERAHHIVMTATSCSYEQAKAVLIHTDYKIKPAIIMIQNHCTLKEAIQDLQEHDEKVRQCIQSPSSVKRGIKEWEKLM